MLLIVESPTKIRTIRKYLPAGWEVAASVGHIRDLPKRELGVDKANAYRPDYEIIPEKRQVVAELKSRVARTGKERVVLATDLDREGEAIAFHLCRALDLDPKKTRRVVFPELTRGAVQAALKRPRQVDLRLVAAQEARRVLDRLVGYELSPLARRKLGGEARSAGRVQSAALRLVVDRERELESYKPRTELELPAAFIAPAGDFLKARYVPPPPPYENLRTLFETLWSPRYRVTNVLATARRQGPRPPFTTSTLQQAASTRLKMGVKVTMKHAQSLFEKGFITWFRQLIDPCIAI
jgi:DNA topoisomerase-1